MKAQPQHLIDCTHYNKFTQPLYSIGQRLKTMLSYSICGGGIVIGIKWTGAYWAYYVAEDLGSEELLNKHTYLHSEEELQRYNQ